MAPPSNLSFRDKVKFALSSPGNFHQAITLQSAKSVFINEDLVPSPPERWTWTAWSFLAYWWSESWNVSTWSLGSSLIALGLMSVSAVVIVLNGFAAARYHIGYPVLARVTFGMYGHYFFVLIRAILGIIWVGRARESSADLQGGVQLYFEGQFISIMLRCIFPSWAGLKNTIPASQGITVYTISIIMPLAGLGVVIWATTANGGVSSEAITVTAEKTSTAVFAFSVIAQFNSGRCRVHRLGLTHSHGFQLGPHCDRARSGESAVQNMWGDAFWNPYDLLNGILDHTYSAKSRAGVFFAAISFAFATLGTSIACNIVREHILTSAPTFLNFLGGYSIFQGSVVSIMLVDYFIVRRGNLDIRAMYDGSRDSKYFFTAGVNWRSVVAFIVGFVVPLPGFIGSFGTVTVSTAAVRLFNLGWELSFLCGGVTYWILCLVFKVPGQEDCQRPFGEMVDDSWTLPGADVDREHMPGEVEDYEKKESHDEVHVNMV
ncbi:hypothetical protein IAU60_004893 [Kwoniella sp. DSM 27419]